LDRRELAAALAPLGIGGQVAGRIFSAVHRDPMVGAPSLDDRRVRGLSKISAAALAAAAEWPELEIIERRRSSDGFLKYLFRLPDGREIEAVRIPLPDPAAARELK